MHHFRRVVFGLLFLIFLLSIGTVGFYFLEGFSWFKAFYFTVITISTVGYGDIIPQTAAGKIFAVFLILGGAGLFFYAFGLISEIVLSGTIRNFFGRRQVEKKVQTLKDHYIICGYGRIGKHICRLIARELPFVIIESDPAVIKEIEADGFLFIEGDATNEEVMIKAGIERARGLVTVLRSDPDNVYIILTARSLNPRIFIMARADDEKVVKRLHQAGANKVFLPYLVGARRMALALMRPAVTDFLELTSPVMNMELQIEEVRLCPDSPLVGKDLVASRIREVSGAIILAVKKFSGDMVFNPPPQYVLEAGDVLIALGERKDLVRLEKLAAGKK